MIETLLYRLLTMQAAITSIVQTRIFPVVMPEGSLLPALTYQIISSSSQQMFNTGGMTRLRVQFDCWSDTYLEACALRRGVAAALDGYKDATFNGLQIGVSDDFEHELLQFRSTIEFYIFTDQV